MTPFHWLLGLFLVLAGWNLIFVWRSTRRGEWTYDPDRNYGTFSMFGDSDE